MRVAITLLGAGAFAGSAAASELEVAFELPRLSVAEYHRPYVAIWIAGSDGKTAADLSVLYDLAMADQEGETWLKDLRQWWRRSGRALDMPVDGVSGPTRPPGEHTVSFNDDTPQIAELEPGKYTLFVEASREVGGREMLSLPFAWPPQTEQVATAAGESELAAVTLTLRPESED